MWRKTAQCHRKTQPCSLSLSGQVIHPCFRKYHHPLLCPIGTALIYWHSYPATSCFRTSFSIQLQYKLRLVDFAVSLANSTSAPWALKGFFPWRCVLGNKFKSDVWKALARARKVVRPIIYQEAILLAFSLSFFIQSREHFLSRYLSEPSKWHYSNTIWELIAFELFYTR